MLCKTHLLEDLARQQESGELPALSYKTLLLNANELRDGGGGRGRVGYGRKAALNC
jgi:hypothetical protein